MTLFRKMVAVLAAAIAFTAAAASAQELKIGLKTEPSSLDPQYHALTPNLQVAFYIRHAGEAEKARPMRAKRVVTDSPTWSEFKLRPA
jgi:peptide/nickel transport system substrate-binding protein